MPWSLSSAALALLCLTGFTTSTTELNSWALQSQSAKKTNTDIEFDKEPVDGSGGWMVHTSDDEDLVGSGSGSGSGMGDVLTEALPQKTTWTTTTSSTTVSPSTGRPLTVCEKLRQASRQLAGRHVPRCLPDGEFDSFQCHGPPGSADCWCSDLEGREIPGTQMEAPNIPNCDNGTNLPLCVHQLVQHIRSKMLGSFRPKCAPDGQFDRVQCQGSMCFCVDESSGGRVSGSEVHIPDTPSCDDDSLDVNVPEVSTKLTLPEQPSFVEDRIDIDEDSGTTTQPQDLDDTIDLDLPIDGSSQETGTTILKDNSSQKQHEEGTYAGGARGHLDEKVKTGHPDKVDEDNSSQKEHHDKVDEDNLSRTGHHDKVRKEHHDGQVEKASEVFTRPGILAGIIGGSIVLLLCVVLFIMFIIYRMRKKDEGSYPLDEPRKPPHYNYVRAPDKEFYA